MRARRWPEGAGGGGAGGDFLQPGANARTTTAANSPKTTRLSHMAGRTFTTDDTDCTDIFKGGEKNLTEGNGGNEGEAERPEAETWRQKYPAIRRVNSSGLVASLR